MALTAWTLLQPLLDHEPYWQTDGKLTRMPDKLLECLTFEDVPIIGFPTQQGCCSEIVAVLPEEVIGPGPLLQLQESQKHPGSCKGLAQDMRSWMIVNVQEPVRRSLSCELKVFAKGIQQSSASKHTSTVATVSKDDSDVQGKSARPRWIESAEREREVWMDGWMDGWIDGWTNWQMDTQIK